MIQKSIFPLRYYVYRRDSGTLHIYDKPDGKLKHEYHSSQLMKVEKSQIVESANVAFPEEYPWLFLLTTETRNFYLYAATSYERDIWVHEFSNFTVGTHKLSDSLQGDIQDKMDPFLQLEVQNLSMHVMEQADLKKASDRRKSQEMLEDKGDYQSENMRYPSV